MALSNQIDFPAFFSFCMMTYRNSSIPEYDNLLSPLPRKMALRRHVLENLLSGIDRLRKVNVTESKADC
jgi:hypothetical protein